MPRTYPSQVLRFIASTAVILLLAAHAKAQAPQKPTPPSPSSQVQLEARVKDLETRLNEAEKKAALAAMEKDYITRTQKQYETYYQSAFSTQVWVLSITGFTLATMFFLAGRFGFDIFTRRIDSALKEATTQLRAEFAERLSNETNALQAAHAAELKTLEGDLTKRNTDLEGALSKRITQQEEDLETRSSFHFRHVEGLAAGADKRSADARASFRWALKIYKLGRPRKLIPVRVGARAAANLFVAVEQEDAANFEENAKKELADPFYNDLEDELASAAIMLNSLAPLLAERKRAQGEPPAATPKPDK
jgi:hypothetical protein